MVAEKDPCSICETPAPDATPANYEGIGTDCPRCGKYMLTGTALAVIDQLTPEDRQKLSGWVYDQNKLGAVPEISSTTLQQVRSWTFLPTIEKGDRLLLEAVRQQTDLARGFDLRNPIFIAATHGKDVSEVQIFAGMLFKKGFLATPIGKPAGWAWRVTPEGHIAAEELSKKPATSEQGFVAMWFHKSLSDAWEKGFYPGVFNAGYRPFRVDRHEHVNKIDDEIIAQIRRSRFVVADFTGHRGGVYFEAGFALGLNLSVIWTCRKDGLDGLHFDIRQFNCIDWESPGDLAARLQVRIEAVIGDGPNKLRK